jgi:putative transposase
MDAAEELTPHVGTVAACRAMGVARATLYRRRCATPRPMTEVRPRAKPARGLSDLERQTVLDALHSERFADQAPAAVYAKLLDEGTYHCSVSTMYRILRENREVQERRNQLRHPKYRKPQLLATAPNQVWSWDITKLLGPAKWTYYYLYVILDIYSRYTVGWMVASCENADLAQRLIRDSIHRQGVDAQQLTLHSDRGPAMKSHSVAQLLATLGVTKSHSRPHVSNDNPFSESQFKTLKYRPEFPGRFGCQQDARGFCQQFFQWYNHEHYHSGIGLMTPWMVHYGHAPHVFRLRQQTLDGVYQTHPERFVNKPPSPPALPQAVWINPPKASQDEHQKRLPETSGSQKPHAPLAHRRLGYPLSGCSSAEPDSVSPSKLHPNSPIHQIQCPLDTGAMPPKTSGVWGQSPHSKNTAREASP